MYIVLLTNNTTYYLFADLCNLQAESLARSVLKIKKRSKTFMTEYQIKEYSRIRIFYLFVTSSINNLDSKRYCPRHSPHKNDSEPRTHIGVQSCC
jgi:hypothetical protein